MISTLLIDQEQTFDKVGCQPAWAGVLKAVSGRSQDPGLRLRRVRDVEEAMASLRAAPVDALLLDRCDIGGIARMQAWAPDLPILAFAEDGSTEVVRLAIEQGAQEVLMPSELKSAGDLRRRIELAITRKAFETRRARHARRDELTGLANRVLLEERFTRALARADRFATLVGLVAIDIDGFQRLIAEHGQTIADRLLPMAGQRFLRETRLTDTLARTRDHGFTWLVEGLPAIDDINALVNRLPKQLTRPFSIDRQDIRLTASVGVAVCPYHGQDFHTVHGLAEAAMLDVSAISGDALLMHPVARPPAPAEPAATN